jgi:hypothetical protein
MAMAAMIAAGVASSGALARSLRKLFDRGQKSRFAFHKLN